MLHNTKKAATMVSQKFCNILVRISLRHVHHVTEAVQVVVGSIVVVSALTPCALLKSLADEPAMSILYEIKLGHNSVEATKNHLLGAM